MGYHTLGSWERCIGERNENFEDKKVYFWFLRVNEQNAETFSYPEEMKFLANFQSRGQAKFELKIQFFELYPK